MPNGVPFHPPEYNFSRYPDDRCDDWWTYLVVKINKRTPCRYILLVPSITTGSSYQSYNEPLMLLLTCFYQRFDFLSWQKHQNYRFQPQRLITTFVRATTDFESKLYSFMPALQKTRLHYSFTLRLSKLNTQYSTKLHLKNDVPGDVLFSRGSNLSNGFARLHTIDELLGAIYQLYLDGIRAGNWSWIFRIFWMKLELNESNIRMYDSRNSGLWFVRFEAFKSWFEGFIESALNSWPKYLIW